jgi:hypothetical protein
VSQSISAEKPAGQAYGDVWLCLLSATCVAETSSHSQPLCHCPPTSLFYPRNCTACTFQHVQPLPPPAHPPTHPPARKRSQAATEAGAQAHQQGLVVLQGAAGMRGATGGQEGVWAGIVKSCISTGDLMFARCSEASGARECHRGPGAGGLRYQIPLCPYSALLSRRNSHSDLSCWQPWAWHEWAHHAYNILPDTLLDPARLL